MLLVILCSLPCRTTPIEFIINLVSIQTTEAAQFVQFVVVVVVVVVAAAAGVFFATFLALPVQSKLDYSSSGKHIQLAGSSKQVKLC